MSELVITPREILILRQRDKSLPRAQPRGLCSRATVNRGDSGFLVWRQ